MKPLFEDQLYVTTPLYYVNARPHIGHAYPTLLADCMVRYGKLRGMKTKFLTGTDEHGEKIANIAKTQKRPPKEYADEIAAEFKSTWEKIGLNPDIFYRTTTASHAKAVQKAYEILKEKGDIYSASYTGKYCVGCERFRTEKEITPEGLCPDHLKAPEERTETNYFFKMGKYRQQLLDFYRENPDAIVPAHYMKETLSFLEQDLEDLSVSRTKARLSWGIPLPFDDQHVAYVWIDALLNYIVAIGYPENFQKDLWEHSIHLIGKDILKTHAIYWPTLLMALDLKPFHRLQVSGYILMDNAKMSKSLGNVVDPLTIHQTYGVECLRYYLLREMSYGVDSTFTWESFVARCNADLANGIGNLSSRVLTIAYKNCDAKVPSKNHREEADLALLKSVAELPEKFSQEFEAARFHMALAAFADVVQLCDRYINDQKPWALAKDPTQKNRLEAVLSTAMDALWTLSLVMAPVLPEGSHKLQKALGRNSEKWSEALNPLIEGTSLGEVPRLYPRLEIKKEE